MMMVVVFGIDEVVRGGFVLPERRDSSTSLRGGPIFLGGRSFSVWKGQADARADPPLIIRWLLLFFLSFFYAP